MRWALGVTKKDEIRNEYVRGTAKIAKLVDKIWNARLRWYGHVKRREEGYVGKRMMKMAVPGRRKRGRLKRRWMDLVREDLKRLELRCETKLVGSNGEYFRAVATPNMAKPKEEEEDCRWLKLLLMCAMMQNPCYCIAVAKSGQWAPGSLNQ